MGNKWLWTALTEAAKGSARRYSSDPRPHRASAQTGREVEFGGGFHPAVAVGDMIVLPSMPTVDVRFVR